MRNPYHGKMKRLIIAGVSILAFSFYLIYSYNNLKGRSYIYEPIYISLKGDIPEKANLQLMYQTFNDPTTAYEAYLITHDSIPENTFIFKIDSSYRVKNFSIYFQSLRENEKLIIRSITASNYHEAENSFSLKINDLIATENLRLDQLDEGSLSIIKIPHDKPMGSALTFYMLASVQNVFVKTNLRKVVFPSLLAFLGILLLGIAMVYYLYPFIARLTWKGVSLGAILLALAIIIMPSGEKTCNLLLILAIVVGLIRGVRERLLPTWVKENRIFLLLILTLILIYSIALLFSGNNPSTIKLIKIKLGLPIALLAVALNTNNKQEIRIQYAALLTGVIISVIIHFGWTIMLLDAVETKSRLFSDPRYYMESTVFSRIHHSYLSILYLISLASLLLKKDIIALSKREIVLFSLLLAVGIFFAFSRAAILSLLLILIFFTLQMVFKLLSMEIARIIRFLAASILTITILTMVFANLDSLSSTGKIPLKGLSTRVEIWGITSDLIKDKPITGWGPGNYKDALKKSSGLASYNRNTWRILNTHNQFLETTGMFGLIVGIGLAWFLMFPTGFSRQKLKYSDFLIAAAIIFITAFFFESILNRNLGVLVFGLCYGLLMQMKTIYDS